MQARGPLPRALAQEAARIIVEHGVDDYLLAKRKAAERLGVTDHAVLPKNTEIEEALAEHHRLFGSDSHAVELAEIRRHAVDAMRLLDDFEPRVVGPVLSGNATPHSEINLHLFSDTPEAVAIRLMDAGVRHRVAERRVKLLRDEAQAFPSVQFSSGGCDVDAVIFPRDGIRQAPFSPVDGIADASGDAGGSGGAAGGRRGTRDRPVSVRGQACPWYLLRRWPSPCGQRPPVHVTSASPAACSRAA